MHIATERKPKKRCVRCREEHDYGKCEEGVEVKCCNGNGSRSVAFGGCEVAVIMVDIENIPRGKDES